MPTIYPRGADPLIFSATLPVGSRDTENAPLAAQNATSFTTVASMTLSLVIFEYPDPHFIGSGDDPPSVPLVEIKTGDGPWQLVRNTVGQGASTFTLGPPADERLVDYTCSSPDEFGVTTIRFLRNNAPFEGQTWSLRVTINDGETGSPSRPQSAVTFSVDSGGGSAPWIATPSQSTRFGPGAIDFGAAKVRGFGLGGVEPNTPHPLDFGPAYSLDVPIGNYGPGTLTLTGATIVASPGAASIKLGARTDIPPGAVVQAALIATVIGARPTATNSTLPFIFTVESDDPLGATDGLNAHRNIVVFSVEMQASPRETSDLPHDPDPHRT